MSGLETRALVKRYGATQALKGLDLQVEPGSVYGLVGPNGSGKTTALEIIVGLRRPTSGSVETGEFGDAIAYCPDAPEFDAWLNAREVVELSARLVGKRVEGDSVAKMLARVGLGDAASRRVGGFSRGMLSRLNLAAALICEPRLLVADEPAGALDPAGRWEVIELLGTLAATTTVVVSSHDLSDVQRICDHVGVLSKGSLVYQGTLRDLLERAGSALRIVVRDPVAPAREALESADWVTGVREERQGVLLVGVNDIDAAERGIPVVLASCGARLVEMGTASSTLEEVFFELTGTGPNAPAENKG